MEHWTTIVDALSILAPLLVPPLLGYIGWKLRELNKILERVDEHDRVLFGEDRKSVV